MSDHVPEENHIRHFMLFEFRKDIKATEATKNICDVYGDVLDVRKCQRWFNKFRSGNVDLSDDHRSGRPGGTGQRPPEGGLNLIPVKPSKN